MSKKTPIQKMEELLCNLPEKDIKFAEKFIKELDEKVKGQEEE